MIPLLLVLKKRNICYIFFFVIALLSGCLRVSSKTALSAEEKAALEPLFRYVLFDNHGAFVLFGSKPMCDALLPPQLNQTQAQKLIEEMPESVRNKVRILELKFDLQQAWKTWTTIQKRFHIKKYILAKISDSIYLINTDKTAKVMKENYDFFRDLLGADFSPEKIISELRNSHSASWEKLFQDHISMGLLYGFGKDNIEIFQRNLDSGAEQPFSTVERIDVFEATPNNFSIPIFVSHRDHPLVQLYEREKQEISRIYHGKDMMSVSLEELSQ